MGLVASQGDPLHMRQFTNELMWLCCGAQTGEAGSLPRPLGPGFSLSCSGLLPWASTGCTHSDASHRAVQKQGAFKQERLLPALLQKWNSFKLNGSIITFTLSNNY